MNQIGNPAASQGYFYTPDGANTTLMTALDLTPPGQPVGGYVPIVNVACVSGAKASHSRHAHYRQARFGGRRER